jgi:hypothetical protein
LMPVLALYQMSQLSKSCLLDICLRERENFRWVLISTSLMFPWSNVPQFVAL